MHLGSLSNSPFGAAFDLLLCFQFIMHSLSKDIMLISRSAKSLFDHRDLKREFSRKIPMKSDDGGYGWISGYYLFIGLWLLYFLYANMDLIFSRKSDGRFEPDPVRDIPKQSRSGSRKNPVGIRSRPISNIIVGDQG